MKEVHETCEYSGLRNYLGMSTELGFTSLHRHKHSELVMSHAKYSVYTQWKEEIWEAAMLEKTEALVAIRELPISLQCAMTAWTALQFGLAHAKITWP